MICLIDRPPVLNDSFLHKKMALLDVWGDGLWYEIDGTGLMCVKNGYAVIDCPTNCPQLGETLAIFGVRGYLCGDFLPGATKDVLRLLCTGENAYEPQSPYGVCAHIAQTFDLPFDQLYTTISLQVRRQTGYVYQNQGAVATVQQGILEGLCAHQKGQGYATQLISQIRTTHSGPLYCACDPSLTALYLKAGFVKINTVIEETFS